MIILITGNPGSGKSKILKLLKDYDYEVVNIDEFVNEIYQVNQIGYILIQTHFGKEFTNQYSVNKPLLRKLVTSNEYDMYRLKILIWPLIKSHLFYLKKRKKFLIVEMAIYKLDPLYFNDIFDKVIEIVRPTKNVNDFDKFYEINHYCYRPDYIVYNNNDIWSTYSEIEKILETIKDTNNLEIAGGKENAI